MLKAKSSLGLVVLVLLLAGTMPAVLTGGGAPVAHAQGGDWKNVSLLYTTDIKGKIEPCG